MARIKKVGHVVLAVHDPERSIKFYTEALGMECVGFMEDMQMGFLAFGAERDHDIAVIKVPDEQPVGSSGLAHTALEIEGGEEGLRELYAKLKSKGINAEFTADHVMTKSLYFLDPDGNRIELFTQVTTPLEGQQLIREAHGAMELLKPLDLETAAAAG
jgi:catechol 2,3-dioxygenase